MTDQPAPTEPPLPTEGGAYQRNPDGSLTLLERTQDPQPAAPAAAEEPTS